MKEAHLQLDRLRIILSIRWKPSHKLGLEHPPRRELFPRNHRYAHPFIIPPLRRRIHDEVVPKRLNLLPISNHTHIAHGNVEFLQKVTRVYWVSFLATESYVEGVQCGIAAHGKLGSAECGSGSGFGPGCEGVINWC